MSMEDSYPQIFGEVLNPASASLGPVSVWAPRSYRGASGLLLSGGADGVPAAPVGCRAGGKSSSLSSQVGHLTKKSSLPGLLVNPKAL